MGGGVADPSLDPARQQIITLIPPCLTVVTHWAVLYKAPQSGTRVKVQGIYHKMTGESISILQEYYLRRRFKVFGI